MAETTQEVKARLSVQTEGEPQAFTQAAEAVSGLSSAAAGSEASLSSLTGELTRLGSSVRELGPAGESFDRFAQAVDRFTKAEGVEEQRKAIEDATAAWKELGNRIPEVFDKGGKAAKDFQATLEALEAQERKLADPLTQSVDRARSAMEALKSSTEGSFDGAEGKLVQVRVRVDEYREALEQAKAAGEGVSSEQIAELDRLEQEYEEATRAVASYKAAKEDVKKEIDAVSASTQNEVGQIGSLRDIAEKASPSLGKLVGVGAAIVGAFTAGYAAGEKLRSVLNSLTDGAFDAFIQKGLRMQAVADKIADGLRGIGRESETLANQRKVFENLGLEGFSQDVEKNQEILQAHGRAVHEDRDRLEEFAKSLGLSRQQLDEQSAALAKSIETFRKANPQIDPKVFESLVKGPIQDLLDAYAKLGVEAPKNLQAVADAWGIATTKAEEATKKHAAAVKALVQEITGVVSRTTAELREQAAVVSEAVAAINTAKVSPEGLDKARTEVQSLVDQFRAAKVEIPASLVAAADKVGVFVAAMERAGGLIPVFSRSTEAAADSTARLGVSADGTRASITGLGESTLRTAGDLETGRQSIESINPVAGQAQLSLDELREKYGAAGRAARDAGTDVHEGLKRVVQGAEALAEAGEHAAESGDALEWAGDTAKAAAEPLERVGTAADKLARGSDAASKGLASLNRGAAASSSAFQGVAADVESLANALDAFGARAASFAGPILIALDQVSAKVKQVRAELEALAAEKAA